MKTETTNTTMRSPEEIYERMRWAAHISWKHRQSAGRETDGEFREMYDHSAQDSLREVFVLSWALGLDTTELLPLWQGWEKQWDAERAKNTAEAQADQEQEGVSCE